MTKNKLDLDDLDSEDTFLKFIGNYPWLLMRRHIAGTGAAWRRKKIRRGEHLGCPRLVYRPWRWV